jgi:hypothetical protein
MSVSANVCVDFLDRDSIKNQISGCFRIVKESGTDTFIGDSKVGNLTLLNTIAKSNRITN